MKTSWLIARTIIKKNFRSPLLNIPIILFPITELLLFGYMNTVNGLQSTQNTFIFGIMLWIAIYRSQIEISSEISEEISHGNLKSIFSAPITIFQYLCGAIISSLLKLMPALFFFFITSQFLFSFFTINNAMDVFLSLVNFIIFGWTIGIFTTGIAIIFGSKVTFLSWFSAVMLYPFLSTYYDASKMSFPFNVIGKVLPTYPITSHILRNEGISSQSFSMGLLLNGLYLIIGIIFLSICFKIALKKGVFYYQ
jgi:hypothetical protein